MLCTRIRTNLLVGMPKGAADAKSPGGIWQSESKYATIISGNYTLWQNFDWSAKKGTTAALNGKTVKATGKYRQLMVQRIIRCMTIRTSG